VRTCIPVIICAPPERSDLYQLQWKSTTGEGMRPLKYIFAAQTALAVACVIVPNLVPEPISPTLAPCRALPDTLDETLQFAE
jgi:hypothetical protein